MAVTLEQVEAAQAKINEMIALLKKQPVSVIEIPEVEIQLAAGERYAGLMLDDSGKPGHHLILLPGDRDDINFADATAWAAEIGGELPTRREQSLLFANLKGEFEDRYYWSSETHSTNSGWAWCQNFGSGGQGDDGKDGELRARAVRRLILDI